MGRRLFAGAVVLSCVFHLGVLVTGVTMGWLPAEGGSLVLLSLAFLLALFALLASLWVWRILGREGFAVAQWSLQCTECGRPWEGDVGFCPACGARA